MRAQTITRGNEPLSNEQLMRVAPSIFAAQPWERMSNRYTFIPTIQIVDKMRAEGFQPVAAMQSRTRIEGKQDFTKHLIRFRAGRSYYWTTPSGKTEVRHPSAYGWPTLYHASTRRVVVGADWITAPVVNLSMGNAVPTSDTALRHVWSRVQREPWRLLCR